MKKNACLFIVFICLICIKTSAFAEGQIHFHTEQVEVYAGDKILIDYKILNEKITVTNAWWQERYSNKYSSAIGSGNSYQISQTEGSLSYIPRHDGECWFEITYLDENGEIRTEKSSIIKVNGITIEVSAPDVSAPRPYTAEVGLNYPISYKITGGRGNYSVTSYFEVSTGDTTATINKEESQEAEGVINYMPNTSIKRFRYHISVRDDYGALAGVAGPYGGVWVEVCQPHDWDSPEYIWSFDYSTLTARRQCKNHPDQIIEETVKTDIDIVSPSETKIGRAIIRSQAFADTSLKSQTKNIVIPALRDMSVLFLPNCIEQIEEECFLDTSCEAIIIPQGCTTIMNKAFANCSSLIYVSVPESVQNISSDAFEGCNNIVIDKKT